MVREVTSVSDVHVSTRYAYYAFIATLPFETIDLGVLSHIGTLSKLAGYMFIATAVLQPHICFRRPPRAFWCFAVYLCVYCVLGATQEPYYTDLMLVRLFTLIQMMILLWISFNLFRYEGICADALLTLVCSCVVLSLLQVVSVAAPVGPSQRATAFGQNANEFGGKLALGLLALVGLAYGRQSSDRKIGFLAWMSVGIIATAIVMTGSRSAMLGLALGLAFLIMKGGSSQTRGQLCLLASLGVAILVWTAYTNEMVLNRWRSTLVEGSLAGREDIMPKAWAMFLEKPVLGWGPIANYFELGFRFSGLPMDPHNLYLWLLTETGLLGTLPFFAALWLAVFAAWTGRFGSEGTLPMAMLLCLLMINMSGTMHLRKLFWIVVAYALASGCSLTSWKQYAALRSRSQPNMQEGLSLES